MDKELKCPCGGKGVIVAAKSFGQPVYYVSCNSCNLGDGQAFQNEELAIAHWLKMTGQDKPKDEPSFTWKEEDGLQVCYMGLLPVGWASEKKFCVFFPGGWDKVSCVDVSLSKARVEGYARGTWREAHGLSRYPKDEPKKE